MRWIQVEWNGMRWGEHPNPAPLPLNESVTAPLRLEALGQARGSVL